MEQPVYYETYLDQAASDEQSAMCNDTDAEEIDPAFLGLDAVGVLSVDELREVVKGAIELAAVDAGSEVRLAGYPKI